MTTKFILFKDEEGFAVYTPDDGQVRHTLNLNEATEAVMDDWSDVLGMALVDYKRIPFASASELSALQKENAELKEKIGAPRRMYPIMNGQSVPWEVLVPFESRALKNHRQSIGRLAERGGLSPCEALAVVNNLEWREIEMIGFKEADRLWQEYATRINQHYTELDTLRTQNRELRKMCKAKDAILEQIAEGKGAFRHDPLEHAENVINESVALAKQALALQPDK